MDMPVQTFASVGSSVSLPHTPILEVPKEAVISRAFVPFWGGISSKY